MKTITRKHRNCPDYGRLKHPKISRDRPRRTVLPLHDLSGAKVHRYTLNPMVMAVRTNEVIEQHDLVKADGEVLKVVSVEAVSEGCVEIKTVKFGRYQI